ncbi:MAG: TIGR02266 family protein [Deltaproteobacteria bacterium]|nr:TIGR02266 family protein [Deltaproteobacteria bacterium]
MSDNNERRLYPRVPLRMLVQFRLHDMDEFMREHAINLSAGGIFVRTGDPHPAGAMIYLQFTLADGAKIIEGLGRVVHVNPPGHQEPGMGIEFVNLDRKSRKLIDKIIKERLAAMKHGA